MEYHYPLGCIGKIVEKMAAFIEEHHGIILTNTESVPVDGDRTTIEKWLEQFFALVTYEISCPVMRDPSLAPSGKTGLIVSALFDYKLTKRIEE